MDALMQNYKTIGVALAALVVAVLASVVIVPETHQAVVIRTGQPVRIFNMFRPDEPYGQTGAGIQFRIPIAEQVQMVDRRVRDLDMQRTQVLSNDQQRLQVDAYARYRIIDPVRLVERAGNERQLESQLLPILTSVVRQELGRRPFSSLISAERGTAMANITRTLDRQAREYGAQVLDVRIKAADLPEGRPLDAAFTRMETDRQEEAATIRAAGNRDAQIIQAEAQAEAARIYADAYNKDPEFYDFYRAMQSYRQTFLSGEGQSSMVLSEDSEYFRQFRGKK
ncbi:protease modulator HflC [Erythrobacter dokdonensis]|jgi:membrane protease subunit HflC|uniref:Protein HflC n=1 Tax=Erythrobacter dokdonensis DSW-74 TaxID=1300349 RepID=A0A1A7BFS1_9SPHN|nr:protease modulator HflC [Erythrobacter dokdonensis]MEE4316846.1 protease modulator HflC [Erythrobacter sp.]OBV10257.1 putative integral membrane proteinase [Erythrobacter dokdonensis DSW-74]